tara:strand:+ start:2226 stop:2435 length:210 start_codon:yes stop_codon:yes gene_type:complete
MKLFTIQWQPKRLSNQEGALIEQTFKESSATEAVFKWLSEYNFNHDDVIQFQVVKGETINSNLIYNGDI